MSGYARPACLGGGAFASVAPATLHIWLAEATMALHDVLVGNKAVNLAYNSGDGQKMVTFTRATAQGLRDHIAEIERALGVGGRRSAIGVRFTG